MTGNLDFSTEKLHTEAAVKRLRALLDHATDSLTAFKLEERGLGSIPPGLARCTRLEALELRDLGLEGPIPVELLRWKFVKGRRIELTGNAGLELPSNIGELGDSVTQIDLSGHSLRGELESSTPRYTGEREERTGERELGNGERSRIVPVACSRGVQA